MAAKRTGLPGVSVADGAKMKPIALRNLAFNQGYARRDPHEDHKGDPVYMASYRRGRERREEDECSE